MRAMNGRLQIMNSPLMRNTFGRYHHSHHHRQRQRLDSDQLPKCVQFDESSDNYRCFCGCFHIKTGGFCIAGSLIHCLIICLAICFKVSNYFSFSFISSMLWLLCYNRRIIMNTTKATDQVTMSI